MTETIIVVIIAALSAGAGYFLAKGRFYHEHMFPPRPDNDWELWEGDGGPPVGATRITMPNHPELSDQGWMVRR